MSAENKDPSPVKMVVCPGCGGPSVYAPSNLFRPFCSERCKNIDFGAWASEGFRLPADTPPDDELLGGSKLQ
ncbi:DNA gyrase inhibitor YacG [Polaromonas jejuensis]|uniref:DNA gyrase inhibitor YacG n=1 Tax=Polaromonas jejuensis TaxID=457502 RepID=A0ABW0QBF7_9BURK|nr:DNA gyrase inhibitor YacG [Polaromonas jejuensis]